MEIILENLYVEMYGDHFGEFLSGSYWGLKG